ncbi:MAG: TIM barrel protein [Pirellulaceae bacterium]|nr:TIM barrel protein [Pirellulaceae bacterium]
MEHERKNGSNSNTLSQESRRQFLKASAATVALTSGVGVLPALARPSSNSPKELYSISADGQDRVVSGEPEKRFKKSVKIGMVRIRGSLLEKMNLLKELGYDGIELNSPSQLTVEEVTKAKEESDFPVHGVVDSVHWRQTLSDPDEKVRAKGVEGLTTAIKDSKAFGGTSVLLVPGVVNRKATYKECWDRSTAEIKKVLPLAEELGIDILFENVWNNFLTDPAETAKYIDQFESERVGAYFDVGNAVKFSPPAEWVKILGTRIKKLDIKDWSKEAGFGAKILDGDSDWPNVMKELRKIDYKGWATAEVAGGGKDRLKDIADRMDRAFAL